MQAELNFGGQKLRVALDRGVSLAIPVEFGAVAGGATPAHQGKGPRHFGAPPAESRPWSVPGFSGR